VLEEEEEEEKVMEKRRRRRMDGMIFGILNCCVFRCKYEL